MFAGSRIKLFLWAMAVAVGHLTAHVQAATTFPDCVNGPLAANVVCKQTASSAERAAALVGAMELSEKLVNLVNTSPGIPRLGLPAYQWWSEALHGVAFSPGVNFTSSPGQPFYSATSFANPILLSAAFDDALVEAVATQISTEARAFSNAGLGGLDYWTPNINPYRDPRWGRGMETPGEDTLHTSRYVKALLRGLEGGHPTTRRIIANCKHFAAYDMERWGGSVRYNYDAKVTLQDLSEYYLPPFKQCARDSNVGSIMCSYNSLSIKGKNLKSNGTPTCASSYLLNDILREHWGWTLDNNWVTSDCNAVLHIWNQFNFTSTREGAAGLAYTAGTDTVCEVGGYNKTAVTGAYEKGLLSTDTVDKALKRLYQGLVRAGYFDGPAAPYRNITWADVNTPAARTLALRSAAEGMVLTKNAGLLPISLPSLQSKTVAIIGNWINSDRNQMLGGYSGMPPFQNSPLSAAMARSLKVISAAGPLNQSTSNGNDTWTRTALATAEKADVVLYFGGIDISVESEALDRYDIGWPSAQMKLITDLAALGKPLVVVQLGTMLDSAPLNANCNVSAVIWAGYPGQDGGTAALDVITGVTAPAGRLPVTQYPAVYASQVPMTDMDLRPSSASGAKGTNPGRTYRWYDNAVLPYGYGLHYTTFNTSVDLVPVDMPPDDTALSTNTSSSSGGTLSNAEKKTMQLSASALAASCKPKSKNLDNCGAPFTIEISVTNTGARMSSFAALAFVRGEYGPAPYPLKTLIGYSKLRELAAGETRKVLLETKLGDYARTAENGDLVLYPGDYEIIVDVPMAAGVLFRLVGDPLPLDLFPQPKN